MTNSTEFKLVSLAAGLVKRRGALFASSLSFSLGRTPAKFPIDRKSKSQVTMELCTEIDGAAAT